METERVRGVLSILSLRAWDGRELILAPDLMDEESREDVLAVGEMTPCVRVVLLDVLPEDRGLVSLTRCFSSWDVVSSLVSTCRNVSSVFCISPFTFFHRSKSSS